MKIRKTIVILLLVLIFLFPFTINAKTKKVRVGYYQTNAFQDYDSLTNTYSGYSYEYLLAIRQYTGWDYEFVKTFEENGEIKPLTFKESLILLENGELDLLNNVSITDERINVFDFSESPSGSNVGYLVTNNETSIAYEDFDSIDSIKVGLIKGSNYNDLLKAYLLENNCNPEFIEYADKYEVQKHVLSGDVQAYVTSKSQNLDVHVIAKFAPDDYYFAVKKSEDKELIKELDRAMTNLKINDPDFETRLDDKYYSNAKDKSIIFTSSEQEYIDSHKTIDIYYDCNWAPVIYMDNSGEAAGALIDFYRQIEQKIGIHFNFLPNSNAKDSYEKFKEGIYPMMSDMGYDYSFANNHNALLTNPFIQFSVMQAFNDKNNTSSGTVALPKDYYIDFLTQSVYGDKYDYKFYDTVEECINAVSIGECDSTFINNYEYQYYSGRYSYRKLSYSVKEDLTYRLSIPVSNSADQRIYTILSKALASFSTDDVSNIFSNYVFRVQSVDFMTTLYKNPSILIVSLLLISFIVFSIVFFIIYYIGMKKKNILILKQNDDLMNLFEQAEKANNAKSDFLSRMSHEIRTPMNAIVGLTSLCKEHEDDPAKIDDYLSKITSSSQILLGIINDVLDMSAIENNKLKIARSSFNLKDVLNGISAIYYSQCKSKGIDFEMVTSSILHETLIGDGLRLNQILLNLISNAYKFTSIGGIKIYVSENKTEINKAFYEFVVVDTGTGMSEEMLTRLFKPFEQENADIAHKYGGSGLGLSITLNLVHLMDGAITVESEKGKGTKFIVQIPFEIDASSENRISINGKDELNILIVDDDKETLDYTAQIFDHMGIKYDCAHNGNEALEFIEKNQNEKYKYNACFIDWKMPEMDGEEITKEIRTRFNSDVVIIIVSSYDISEISDRAKKAGVDMFLSKPLFQSSIFNLLMNLTGGKLVNDTKSDEEYNFIGKKIILAEDNEFNTLVATELLEMVGFTVIHGSNGKEAVDLFEASTVGELSLILMDIQMPEMDGYEATRKIRHSEHKDSKSIPIIAMTANAFNEDIAKSLANGMNDHIAKPIDTALMYKIINKYII